jgi:hypothetical protein
MIKSTLLLATSSVLLFTSIGASAGPATSKSLEITGVLQEQVGPEPRCPSKFGGTLTGHGNSPTLGRVVFIATDCITQSGPLFSFSHGRMIIVTRSGEQIYADYSGQFVPTGEGTKYVFSGATFQIIGGNGRFSKASGGGTLAGSEDMATGAGTVHLSGRIHHKDKDKDKDRD